MRANLQLDVSATMDVQPTTDPSLVSTKTIRLLAQLVDELSNGTGADHCNQVYTTTGSIAAAGNTTIDLAASVTDVFGATITFTAVKMLLLKNTSTTQAILALGGGTDGNGTNAFDTWVFSAAGAGAGDGSERVRVRAGGLVLLYAPDQTAFAVTAGTGDILRIAETATLAATYELAIVGTA